MNITEAKNIQITEYLQANGHVPVRVKYGNAWFLSPMRNERTPSFKVSLSLNVWFDYGIGEGGNLIALVKKMNNVDSYEAINVIGAKSYSEGPCYESPSDKWGHIRIERIQALNNVALLRYLAERKVSLPFARVFLKQAYYTVHGRTYFALAFKNDKDGYELRNAFFKVGSSPKYYTTIPGIDNSRISVFEGFMDFLSCCTYCNRIPLSQTIILNSLSFLPKVESVLEKAKEVNLFLDNDNAGRDATKKIMSKYTKVADWASVLYPDHKDFNDFIMNRNHLTK